MPLETEEAHVLVEPSLVDVFWDLYEEGGLTPAIEMARSHSNGDLTALEQNVPFLVMEAKNRDIDLIKFLTELDAQMEKEEDAAGITDDACELPADGSDDDVVSEDEDESAEARASDRPSDDGEEE